MSRTDLASCKQPPDRPQADRGGAEDLSLLGGEGNVAGNCLDNPSEGFRGKMQRTDGSFSGEISLKPREEEWMMEHEFTEQEVQKEPLSYREALKPKTYEEKEYERMQDKEDGWDGNLLFGDQEEILRGISITSSEKGPVINFTEEERQRLERYWQNTLIVKLLGGTMGFMQMRRKVQTMWGKSGKVELNVIGNGFMLVSFTRLDDYYFALEGGPWLIQILDFSPKS